MREINAGDLKIGEDFEYDGEPYLCTDTHQRALRDAERGFVWGVLLEGSLKGCLIQMERWARVKVDRPEELLALVQMKGEDSQAFTIPPGSRYHVLYLDGWNPDLTGIVFDRVLYSPKARRLIELLNILKAHTK